MSLESILRQAGWKPRLDSEFWQYPRHGSVNFSTECAIENEVDRLRAQVASMTKARESALQTQAEADAGLAADRKQEP